MELFPNCSTDQLIKVVTSYQWITLLNPGENWKIQNPCDLAEIMATFSRNYSRFDKVTDHRPPNIEV